MWPRIIVAALPLLLQWVPSRGADALFDDPVVAKGIGFEIRESHLQEAYVAHKAAAAAVGQRQPLSIESQLKRQILDKMIATRLLFNRATTQDKEQGRKIADKLIEESRQKAGSDASYRRRLLAVGSSPENYEAEILEQAVVQAVIDRELKFRTVVSQSEINRFYEENPRLFQEPEKARVAHILFATRKIPGGEPLPLEQRLTRKAAAEKAVARARAGENFVALVEELSDDPESRKTGGELIFSRGGAVPPQFESAAFSLEPGQISDPVLTVFGYHVIKLLEKNPPSRAPLDKVNERIRESLQRESVQAKLPGFLSDLKKQAEVQVLLANDD